MLVTSSWIAYLTLDSTKIYVAEESCVNKRAKERSEMKGRKQITNKYSDLKLIIKQICNYEITLKLVYKNIIIWLLKSYCLK